MREASGSEPVTFLGLAYKDSTPVIEESHALKIATIVAETGHQTICFDPYVGAEARSSLVSMLWKDRLEDLPVAGVWVLCNPALLSPELDQVHDVTVVDVWGALRGDTPFGRVVRPGRGQPVAPAEEAEQRDRQLI